MAARAANRRVVEEQIEERNWAAEQEARAELSRITPEYLAGPPDGCTECYLWVPDKFSTRWYWSHRTVTLPGHERFCGCDDHCCQHDCHPADDRPWAGNIALA